MSEVRSGEPGSSLAAGESDEGHGRVHKGPLRRVLRIGGWTAAALALVVVVASLIPVPYYAITPGVARNVDSMIGIPAKQDHAHRGGIFLTDVDLVTLRAIQFPFFWLNHDNEIVAKSTLVGSLTADQYLEQGVIDMATARQAATIVALQTAGYHVKAVPDGVVDYQSVPGSPGASALEIGDVITAIDNKPTLSFAALHREVVAHRAGATIEITRRSLGSSTTHRVRLRLGELWSDTASTSSGTCVVFGSHRLGRPLLSNGRSISCIGILLKQIYRSADLPFSVNLNSEGIIGPSAGLAFTLGLLEKLDPQELTGGSRVAATGTMSVTGQVGDVGGVAQKTVAARDAGVRLFLVPPQEYAVAKARAGSGMQVVAVSTIAQALAALERIGGHIMGLKTP